MEENKWLQMKKKDLVKKIKKIGRGGKLNNWIIPKEDLRIYFNNRRIITKNELISYYINKYKI